MRFIKRHGFQIFAIAFISVMATLCAVRGSWWAFSLDVLLVLSNVGIVVWDECYQKKIRKEYNNFFNSKK